MTTRPATASVFTSLFLYGTDEKPTSVEDRLRDIPPNETIEVYVGHSEFMATVGRFAYPARAAIVKDFFSGQITQDFGILDSNGSRRITIKDYLVASGTALSVLQFDLSNYGLMPSTTDFKERAYIWGTTEYTINDNAVLVWAESGERWIEGLEIGVFRKVGADENFDYEASNRLAQLVNDSLFSPNIDPYGIGRRVDIEFTNEPGRLVGNYSIADYFDDNDKIALDLFGNPAGFVAAGISLVLELFASGVIEYTDEDRLLIYGSSGDDALTSASAKHPSWYDVLSTLPADYGITFVAGAGNDTVYGTDATDVIYAGSGDDIASGNGGADTIYGRTGDDIIDGGDGDDFLYGDEGNDALIGGDGADFIFGGVGDDIIYGGPGDVLTGGPGIDTFVFDSVDRSTPEYWNASSYITDLEDQDIVIVDGIRITGGNVHTTTFYPDPGDTSVYFEWTSQTGSWADPYQGSENFYADGGQGYLQLQGNGGGMENRYYEIGFTYTGVVPAGIVYTETHSYEYGFGPIH